MPALPDRSNLPTDGSPSEPLGLKHPLLTAPSLVQGVLTPQFIAPVGARSLMPDLPATPDYPPSVSFADSPFFADSRSALTIQRKRSTVTAGIEPTRMAQTTHDRVTRDRGIPQLPNLQRFSEPLPSSTLPRADDETSVVPVAPINPSNHSSDRTTEVASPVEASSPLMELGSDQPSVDRPQIDSDQFEQTPEPIEQPLSENLPSQQHDIPSDSGLVNSDLTAPPSVPAIQARMEAPSTEAPPRIPPQESAQLEASPQINPTSTPAIARKPLLQPKIAPEVPADPSPSSTPLQVIPLNIQTQSDSSQPNTPQLNTPQPNTPQLNTSQPNTQLSYENTKDETAPPSNTPVQKSPEQSVNRIQPQVDSLPGLNEAVTADQPITAAPIPVAPESALPEESRASQTSLEHSPTQDSDGAVPLSGNSPIASTLPDSPAPIDSSSTASRPTDFKPIASTTPTIQTRLETTATNLPVTPALPIDRGDSAEPITSPQPPAEKGSDTAFDSVSLSAPPDGMVSDFSIPPAIQRSPTEQATNLQSDQLQSNQVQLRSEPDGEQTIPQLPSAITEPVMAPADITTPDNPPSDPFPLPPSETRTTESTAESTAELTVKSAQADIALPPSTLHQNNDLGTPSNLQLKQSDASQPIIQTQLELRSGDADNVQEVPIGPPLTDAAVPVAQLESRAETVPTIDDYPEPSLSTPAITPVSSDSEATTASTGQPTSILADTPAPVTPTQTHPTAERPSPTQPFIQRQTAPNVEIPTSPLLEQQQVNDRHPILTDVIATEPPVTERTVARKKDSPDVSAIPGDVTLSPSSVNEDSKVGVTPTNSTPIQTRPESGTFPQLPRVLQSLTTLHPLGNTKPLVQPSLLTSPVAQPTASSPNNLLSKEVQPFAAASPDIELNELTPQVVQRQTEARVKVPPIVPPMSERISSPEITPSTPTANVPSEDTPDSWSGIDELLGTSSRSSTTRRSSESPPDSWSSIDELLGRSPASPVIQRLIDEPQADSIFNLNRPDFNQFDPDQRYQPLSDLSQIASSSIAALNGNTNPPAMPDEAPALPEPAESGSDDQSGAQSTQPSKHQDEAEKLEELARQIYQLLRQRFEIERERHGNYYSNRLF